MARLNFVMSICCFCILFACSGETSDEGSSISPQIPPPLPVIGVDKSNDIKVYMHYMPWFDTPQSLRVNSWGIHWTMRNRRCNVIDGSGRRDIASFFYPLIGTYASNDRDVIEYHLLLMKYAGIDGVLIDWYGTAGTNGDIDLLLRNSNAIIDRIDEAGMSFAVVLEDRFADDVEDVKTNMTYLKEHYFNKEEYIRVNDQPLVLVFGPITVAESNSWTDILSLAGEDLIFLPLGGFSERAGSENADGEYAWVTEGFIDELRNFYTDQENPSDIIIGSAYPGYRDFYEQGGWVDQHADWQINVSKDTLEQTLDLAREHRDEIDMLQLVTWNDYGEGTMLEPTREFQFDFLKLIQEYTGVSYNEEALQLIHRYYLLRKRYPKDTQINNTLDHVFYNLAALKLDDAKAHLATIE